MRYEAFQDKLDPDQWRVEYIDFDTGRVDVIVFTGPHRESLAIEFAEFKNAQ